MERSDVLTQLKILIKDQVSTLDPSATDFDADTQLKIILSESVSALKLLTTVEDEFEIEIDDDEITLDFFSKVETMLEVICSHI